MRRYELEDHQWEMISDLFPSNEGKRGAPWKDHRKMLNGMFWILCSGRHPGEIYLPDMENGTASAAELYTIGLGGTA